MKGVDLSGVLLPWANRSPIYVRASTPDQYYLPCFTGIDNLRDFLLSAKVFEYEVKRVGNGVEFLQSFVGSNITIVLNPTQLPEDQPLIVKFHLPVTDSLKIFQC